MQADTDNMNAIIHYSFVFYSLMQMRHESEPHNS